MAEKLRIIPLGGLGEIGKNMLALEYQDDIIVIDCGVQFPDEGLLGVDLIIPDVSYLADRAHQVRGILITHGHEDHIGALPFILPQLPAPVFAPRLAHGLISAKLKERRTTRDFPVTPIDPGTPIQFGQNFAARWFRVCHSIPDAMGIAISTPLGTVIHTGDFKIDHTPVDGRTIDLSTLARYGSEGVLLLLSDSTYAEVPGYTPSEQVVGEALDRAIREAPGRVMVATFASLVSRVQQVADAAHRYDRKISIVGRSMVDTVNVAVELGYLRLPRGILQPLHITRDLPPEKVVLLTTGSQGEPTSALVRIANEEHRDVRVLPGDTIVISATPIPGNELPVSRTIDNLLRQGARVLYDRIATVHVHGHASQEELKLVLSLVKPRYFVPVHGEYRHLNAHAQLAWDMGVGQDGIFVLEDGDVLEITPTGAALAERINVGPTYVDGLSRRDIQSPVLTQRRSLSRDGVLVIALTVTRADGQPTAPPRTIASGFMEETETAQLFQDLNQHILTHLSANGNPHPTTDDLKQKIRETARTFITTNTRRTPTIIPIITEI